MLCPKCQAATLVLEMHSPDSNDAHANNNPMIERGLKLFGWWTDEFQMAKRECLDCGHRFETIEMTIDDFRDALAEVIREGVLSPFIDNEHIVTDEERMKE